MQFSETVNTSEPLTSSRDAQTVSAAASDQKYLLLNRVLRLLNRIEQLISLCGPLVLKPAGVHFSSHQNVPSRVETILVPVLFS